MSLLFYNYIPILSNHIIDFPKKHYDQWGFKTMHNYPEFNINNINDNDIIFVKTDLLQHFFKYIYTRINKKFILLTGVAGLDVKYGFREYLNENKIIKWIGCNICFEHPKVIKIPIGFGYKEQPNGNQSIIYESYINRKQLSNKENKLLITHLGNTHNSRNNIVDIFRNKDYVFFSDKMNFEEYMKTIDNYKFVLCPRGCGTDTHRFWEVLLMGSIPIVEKNGLSDLYDKFPCIIVDNFKDINKDMLDNYIYDTNKYKNIDKYLLIEEFNKLI